MLICYNLIFSLIEILRVLTLAYTISQIYKQNHYSLFPFYDLLHINTI